MSLLFVLPACALVEIHEPDPPNEGNGESVAVPADSDQRIDEENQEEEDVIAHTSVNNSDIDSVTVPADHRIDVQNREEEVIAQTSANNPAGEGDPINGDLAARLKIGSKIGIFAAGTSVAWTIPVFNSSGNYHEKNLCYKLLLGASLLFMLVSFVFGVVLLQGRPFFHLDIFPMNNPKSMGRIKFGTGVALVSITMVMIFGFALIIRQAY